MPNEHPQPIHTKGQPWTLGTNMCRATFDYGLSGHIYMQYAILHENLIALLNLVETGQMDELDAATESVSKVIKLLYNDPVAVARGSITLLASVHYSLHDVSQGAKPALFDVRGKPKGGRPSGTSSVRPPVVLIYNILLHAKIDREESARWLAAELKKKRIVERGKSIEANQIKRWRDELNGQSPWGSDQFYRVLESGTPRQNWSTDPNRARDHVRKLIQVLVVHGFTDRRRRLRHR